MLIVKGLRRKTQLCAIGQQHQSTILLFYTGF